MYGLAVLAPAMENYLMEHEMEAGVVFFSRVPCEC